MPRISITISLIAIGAFCLETVAASAPAFLGTPSHLINAPQLVQKVHNCHANTRYNYVPEINQEARHRHRGSDCAPIILESQQQSAHCHADGRKHRHSGVGNKVHSHYGNNCSVDVWGQSSGSGSNQGCIKVGPVLFCP